MKNMQPTPEHVWAELVQGQLLYGGLRAIRKPRLCVLRGMFVGLTLFLSWDIKEGSYHMQSRTKTTRVTDQP